MKRRLSLLKRKKLNIIRNQLPSLITKSMYLSHQLRPIISNMCPNPQMRNYLRPPTKKNTRKHQNQQNRKKPMNK